MKHNVKITIFLVTLFFISQIIGLAITNQYIDFEATQETGNLTWQPLPPVGNITLERPDIEESQSFLYIFFALIIGTILILLIIKFKKLILWKIWYLIAIIITLTIAFGAFVNGTISFIISVIFGYLKVFKPNAIIHNFTELFIYAGLAALFVPIINLPAIIILLILVSIYDAYAVLKSKHMIKMAKFQAKAKVFAGMLIPYKIGRKPKKGEKAVKVKIRTAVLGGGDIAFPLLFAGVVMKTHGFAKSLIIPPFVTLALFLLLYKGSQEKFYPAMPFLTIGCFVGYGVLLLVNLL